MNRQIKTKKELEQILQEILETKNTNTKIHVRSTKNLNDEGAMFQLKDDEEGGYYFTGSDGWDGQGPEFDVAPDLEHQDPANKQKLIKQVAYEIFYDNPTIEVETSSFPNPNAILDMFEIFKKGWWF